MLKESRKTIPNYPKRPDLTKKVADIHGVTTRYVRMILAGDRNNDEIFATYMQLKESDNLLLAAVKKTVELRKKDSKNSK